jgi:hypothetical protein
MAMRVPVAALFVWAIILVVGRSAQAEDLSFFTLFKKICIDTALEPDAVRTAVEAVGGRQSAPPLIEEGLVSARTVSWRLKLSGQDLYVSASTSRDSNEFPHPMSTLACSMMIYINVDASVAAARDWVGVPADGGTNSNVTYYNFQEVDQKRLAMPTDKDAQWKIMAEGRAWMLNVLQRPDGASLSLMKFKSLPKP